MVIRAVDLRVARRAVLEAHGRLVVEAWRVRRSGFTDFESDVAVALQAELIHVIALQHLRIA